MSRPREADINRLIYGGRTEKNTSRAIIRNCKCIELVHIRLEAKTPNERRKSCRELGPKKRTEHDGDMMESRRKEGCHCGKNAVGDVGEMKIRF